jgi:Hemerythrin HHE cation binding domain
MHTLEPQIMTTTFETPSTAQVESAANPGIAAPPRVDLYASIHKGLRLFMCDTLSRVGKLDCGDETEVVATLGQLSALLDICRNHLGHENDFVHPAIEARRPGAAARVEGEHVEHLCALAGLAGDAAALRALPTAAAAQRLYRHLAVFVGENFIHMDVEETAHNAALWSAYTDAELMAIHDRLLTSIAPSEMALTLRWMVPAMSPVERAAMLGAMAQQMSPEAMRGVLDIVRPQLDERAWAKLERALGLPPVPGLMTA